MDFMLCVLQCPYKTESRTVSSNDGNLLGKIQRIHRVLHKNETERKYCEDSDGVKYVLWIVNERVLV